MRLSPTHGVALTRTHLLTPDYVYRLQRYWPGHFVAHDYGHSALPTLPYVPNCRATGLGLG